MIQENLIKFSTFLQQQEMRMRKDNDLADQEKKRIMQLNEEIAEKSIMLNEYKEKATQIEEKVKNDTKLQKDRNSSSGEEDGNIEFNKEQPKKSDDEEDFILNFKGADEENDEDDTFNNLKKLKGQRYWAEDNPTIKCHNCKQIGHK